MIFIKFLKQLEIITKTIKIGKPVNLQVKRLYWGAPTQTIADLPAVIATMTEPERTLGFGSREQIIRVNLQLMVGKSMPDNSTLAEAATVLWFAAKRVFDKNTSINGTVEWSTLRGADPTVPVILQHSGYTYIGFNSYLDILAYGAFDFGGA